jgi:hypothetical protein
MLYTIFSSDFHILNEFAQATIENMEIINIAMLEILIIHHK